MQTQNLIYSFLFSVTLAPLCACGTDSTFSGSDTHTGDNVATGGGHSGEDEPHFCVVGAGINLHDHIHNALNTLHFEFAEDMGEHTSKMSLSVKNSSGKLVDIGSAHQLYDPTKKVLTWQIEEVDLGDAPWGNFTATLSLGEHSAECRFFIAASGDTDLDGDVDSLDLLAMSPKLNTGLPATWAEGDFNGDGIVDSLDLLLVSPSSQLFEKGPYGDPGPFPIEGCGAGDGGGVLEQLSASPKT